MIGYYRAIQMIRESGLNVVEFLDEFGVVDYYHESEIVRWISSH